MAGGHFRGNVSFGWDLTTNPPGPFHQYSFQARQEVEEASPDEGLGFPGSGNSRGGLWAPVVVTVAAPLGRHGVCVVLSSCVQLRKVVFGCFVSSISCVCLVVCVLGNCQVDSCRVTMFSEWLLLPFQATS